MKTPRTEAEAVALAQDIGRLNRALAMQEAEARQWNGHVRKTRALMRPMV